MLKSLEQHIIFFMKALVISVFMKRNLIVFLSLLGVESSVFATRLKDIVDLKGVKENQLFGFGLVVGLNGTGDSKSTEYTRKAIANMLNKIGPATDVEKVNVQNMASVMVTANLKPFAKIGDRIDLTLSSIGDAKSLAGGTLVFTQLYGADQKVYVVGQGSVSVGGLEKSKTAEHKTVGVVPQGGMIEKDMTSDFIYDNKIEMSLHNPDFTTAARIERQVNIELGGLYANAVNNGQVTVIIPDYYQDRKVSFVSLIENIEVDVDTKAIVIVNERTATVVMGEHVRISTVAISHGELSLQVQEVSTAKKKNTDNVKDATTKLNVLESGTNIGTLVKALNMLGVTPKDLIVILQALKSSGALKAELRFI